MGTRVNKSKHGTFFATFLHNSFSLARSLFILSLLHSQESRLFIRIPGCSRLLTSDAIPRSRRTFSRLNRILYISHKRIYITLVSIDSSVSEYLLNRSIGERSRGISIEIFHPVILLLRNNSEPRVGAINSYV